MQTKRTVIALVTAAILAISAVARAETASESFSKGKSCWRRESVRRHSSLTPPQRVPTEGTRNTHSVMR